MTKLFYCCDCKKILKDNTSCSACQSSNIKPLREGTSVNVIGTKKKGKIYRIYEHKVKLLVINAAKEKLIKTYTYDQLKKVL